MTDMRGQLTESSHVETYALAGNATITVKSLKTGQHFTYRIRQPKTADGIWFVSLMNGPDNESNYAYIGQVYADKRYQHGRKSKISADSPAARAFNWLWQVVRAGKLDAVPVEVWHEGRCGRCNRKLTVPESVERGLGPECAKV